MTILVNYLTCLAFKILDMKNLFLFFIILFIPMTIAGQTATINKIWLEHDVRKKNSDGMVIHVDLSVKGMKGHTLEGIAYFYDSNKKKLKQPLTKSDYCTSSNNVCASDTDSDIPYESTHYSDFDIFIPYWAIPMFHGRHTYYVLVDFRDVDSGKWLTDNYDYVSFIGNYSGYGNDNPTPAIKNPNWCLSCSGSRRCTWCSGTGRYYAHDRYHRCGTCYGSGICAVCNGSGVQP